MVIGIEWGRKSVAYERLFDIAEVLGVSVSVLLEPVLHMPEQGTNEARSRSAK